MYVQIKSRQDYLDLWKDISKPISTYRRQLRSSVGEGDVYLLQLSPGASVVNKNFLLKEPIEMHYEMPEDFLKIGYCGQGAMQLVETEEQEKRYSCNKLVLSVRKEKKTTGTMIFDNGQKYSSMGIALNRKSAVNYFGSDGEKIWRQFLDNWEDIEEDYPILVCPPSLQTAFLQFEQALQNSKHPLFYFESKIMEILALIISEVSASSTIPVLGSDYELSQIERIPNILEEHLLTPLTLADLSRITTLNTKKLQQLFKSVYGETVHTYYKRIRMEQAAKLLHDTTQHVDEIAFNVGYSSPAHFRSAFKHYFGLSPTEYSGRKKIVKKSS